MAEVAVVCCLELRACYGAEGVLALSIMSTKRFYAALVPCGKGSGQAV